MEKSKKTTPNNNPKIDIARRIYISNQIAVRDITLQILAKELETTPSILNRVISGTKKSYRVAKNLCDFLNLCMDIVFPDYPKKNED